MNVWIPVITALVGAVVGGIFGMFGSLVKDKVQWNRDHQVRYNDRRITAYADLITHGKIAAERHDKKAFDDFQYALRVVALLATKPTKEAAELVGQAVKIIVNTNAKRPTEERYDPGQQDYLSNVTEGFLEAAHKELGTDDSLHARRRKSIFH